MRALFWASAAFLGATWVGYPAALALTRRRPVKRGPLPGRVGVVCVARDEAAGIGRRVSELLAQTRVPDALVVVDDGSTDGTAEVAAAAGPVVVVRRPSEGKAAGIAAGVAALDAHAIDVVVFCDVRQRLAPDAIENLTRAFVDPSVGCASGVMTTAAEAGPGWYWRYETMVRLFESRGGSVVGATGALYAVRRALFVPPPPGLILDDVWVPMHAAKAGYRVTLEQDAHVEDVEADVAHEARRKLRTLAGNHQLLAAAPWMTSPRENPLYWRMLMHKRARLVAPFALLTLGVAAAANARRPFYGAVALGLGGMLATWAIRKKLDRSRDGRAGFGGRLGALAETVVELHVSAARSWLEARRGDIRWR